MQFKECVTENREKSYTCNSIHILYDRQPSRPLVKLAHHNRIQMVWVQGHMGIDENETTYQLAEQGPCLFPNKFQICQGLLSIPDEIGRT
jgi:ribonuclease HI